MGWERAVRDALSRPLLDLDPVGDPVEDALRRVLAVGRVPGGLAGARTARYREAAVAFGDPRPTAAVARVEELSAEAARLQGDLRGAWGAWRSAAWIHHTLGHPGQGERDRVLALLHLAVGRREEGLRRLEEAANALDGPIQAEARALWQLVASGDAS